jgi:hypothetical protein
LPFIRVYADFISNWYLPLIILFVAFNYGKELLNFIRGAGAIK